MPMTCSGYLESARRKRERGEYSAAMQDCQAALRAYPTCSSALRARGLVFLGMENFQEAIRDFSSAILYSQTPAWLYYHRGWARRCLKDYEAAMLDINRCIALDQKEAHFFNVRGILHAEQGRYELAVADYERAVSLAPPKESFLRNLGAAYRDLDRFESALSAYNQALTISPDNLINIWRRGDLFYRFGLFARAEEDYTRVISLGEASYVIYYYRADARALLGQYPAALEDYNKALRMLEGELSVPFAGRAWLKKKLEDPEYNRDYEEAQEYDRHVSAEFLHSADRARARTMAADVGSIMRYHLLQCAKRSYEICLDMDPENTLAQARLEEIAAELLSMSQYEIEASPSRLALTGADVAPLAPLPASAASITLALLGATPTTGGQLGMEEDLQVAAGYCMGADGAAILSTQGGEVEEEEERDRGEELAAQALLEDASAALALSAPEPVLSPATVAAGLAVPVAGSGSPICLSCGDVHEERGMQAESVQQECAHPGFHG